MDLAKTINYTVAEAGSTVFTFPTHAPTDFLYLICTGNIDVYFVVSKIADGWPKVSNRSAIISQFLCLTLQGSCELLTQATCLAGDSLINPTFIKTHTLWQYRLWSFQTGGTKLERFLPKNQHTQRKLLSLENWISGGLRSFLKSEF